MNNKGNCCYDRSNAWNAFVVARLEEAGATHLAMRPSGFSTRSRNYWPDMIRDSFIDLPADTLLRLPTPSRDRIDRMDEAFAWLRYIPDTRYVLRRIVGARALVNPVTERYLWPWRRLGDRLGADYRAVQRWHAEGIDLIVAELHRRRFAFPP